MFEFGRPELHLVTDPGLPLTTLLESIRQAAEHGVDWVHVRHPDASERQLFELVTAVLSVCKPRGVRVAVNTCVGVALAAGAEGVQVTSRGLPVGAVRSVAGALRVGASVHSLEEAVQAAAEGADWLLLGNILATGTHPERIGLGLQVLRRVADTVRIPVIALGGIRAPDVQSILQAGAAGVAVVSAILHAADPARATTELRVALGSHH